MEFIEVVEKIKSKYRSVGKEEIPSEVTNCLSLGGTLGERFLILADWLKRMKVEDFNNYKIAYEENESIIIGSNKFYTR